MNTTQAQQPSVKFFIILSGIVVLGIALKELQNIFLPFIIAYFLFFMFSPLNYWLRHKRVPTFIIIPLNLILMVIFFTGAGRIIYTAFEQISADLPSYYNKLNFIVREAAFSFGIKDPYFTHFSVEKVIERLDYQSIVTDFFTMLLDFSGKLFFVVFFFAFIISGHPAIYSAIKKRYVAIKVHEEEEKAALEESAEFHYDEKQLEQTFKEITIQIQRYIVTKVAINLSAGVVLGFILWLMNVDFPFVWGIFTFLFNFVPTIGSAVSLLLPTLMALIQFDAPGYALLVAVVIMLIQTLFFNILEPVVLGKNLGLNPIAILLAVLLWGYIWGIAGMLLAVPLTAIIKIVLSNGRGKNMQFINQLMGNKQKE